MARLLDIHETARFFGVSPQTIWRWLRNNSMPRPASLNGIQRWRLADLETWIEAAASPSGAIVGTVRPSTLDFVSTIH